jgi:hypothetical protein
MFTKITINFEIKVTTLIFREITYLVFEKTNNANIILMSPNTVD